MKKSRIGKNCQHGPSNVYRISSPVGPLRLETCVKGVHDLHQIQEETHDAVFKAVKSAPIKLVSQMYPDNGYQYPPVQCVLKWLQNYFHGKSDELVPPNICYIYAVEGSFRYRVWRTLLDTVKFGETVSYNGLAIACGSSSNACRAVGQAMRNNPVQLIIPCHRVIRSDGSHGMYARGTRNLTKKWLLEHENSSNS